MSHSNFVSNDLLLSSIPWERLKEEINEIVAATIKAQLRENLQEKLLSPTETCAIFQPKLSKTTLKKWSRDGRLKEHRFGGRVYYKYGDVLDASKTLRRYARA
jgi:hypothetical protein